MMRARPLQALQLTPIAKNDDVSICYDCNTCDAPPLQPLQVPNPRPKRETCIARKTGSGTGKIAPLARPAVAAPRQVTKRTEGEGANARKMDAKPLKYRREKIFENLASTPLTRV